MWQFATWYHPTVTDVALQTRMKTPEPLQLVEHIASGKTIEEMAAQLYPDNLKARRAFTRRCYQRIGTDEKSQAFLAEAARAMMMAAIPGVTMALIRRAMRGRPDAIKLLFEASGFHNPKVDHRHTGDIQLRLVTPRPSPAQLDSPPPSIEGTAHEVS